ncbi:MAG: ferredoxin-thioredoxin reductase catalytic domain-containing protein [Brevinematales bacterium]
MNKERIDSLYQKLKEEAEASGYHLNPDEAFTRELVESLIINEDRYGYPSCPCRLSTGIKEEDLDIICPCDYRDQDLIDYGTCYCGLYVSQEVTDGKKKLTSIPDRRKKEKKKKTETTLRIDKLSYPIWRCKVCGYLCARETPPEVCPICKASKERFERFL